MCRTFQTGVPGTFRGFPPSFFTSFPKPLFLFHTHSNTKHMKTRDESEDEICVKVWQKPVMAKNHTRVKHRKNKQQMKSLLRFITGSM